MNSSKIFVAGHCGMVGSAIVRTLTSPLASASWQVITRTRRELDLTDTVAVRNFFSAEQPEVVVIAAAKVGGIKANNDYPVDFLLENLKIQNNLIEAAANSKVQKLLFLGSSCIYPKFATQPIREDSLLTGILEPTNEPYALAKITGIKLCLAYRKQYGLNFISAMPTNLYGPGDNYDPVTSHVLPALIGKFHRAKINQAPEVVLWGSGTPRREFLHADDLASACLLLLEKYNDPEPINIGCGEDLAISELAELVRNTVGYQGQISWDASQPDGTPRKLLDISRIRQLGWSPKISLADGLKRTYQEFLRLAR
ncbi:MAG: GDP-L-fucose synthase [Verrucomicrobiales bacterium]|jgi:GDP-L-fucose synthase|nr:GDP-L-fucose synthase [Verrucomicrobiales bacterium]